MSETISSCQSKLITRNCLNEQFIRLGVKCTKVVQCTHVFSDAQTHSHAHTHTSYAQLPNRYVHTHGRHRRTHRHRLTLIQRITNKTNWEEQRKNCCTRRRESLRLVLSVCNARHERRWLRVYWCASFSDGSRFFFVYICSFDSLQPLRTGSETERVWIQCIVVVYRCDDDFVPCFLSCHLTRTQFLSIASSRSGNMQPRTCTHIETISAHNCWCWWMSCTVVTTCKSIHTTEMQRSNQPKSWKSMASDIR